MHEDIKWFLGLVVVMIAVAYIGWKNRGVEPPPAPSVQSVRTEPAEAAPERSGPEGEDINAQIRKAEAEVTRLQEEIKKKEADARLSPLAGKILIRSASPRGAGEYLLIETARDAAAPVLITGLTVQAQKGRLGASIPKAFRLPFPGAAGDGDPVFLKPGEVAYIITGRSANGTSFQLNRCTGYFEQGMDFRPSLPQSCPRPIDEPLPPPPNELSETCTNYIQTLPICTRPAGTAPAALQYDGSCQAHLSRNIGYDSCVSIHKNEPNFFSGDWRIFLGRDSALWGRTHDTIELLDQDGKVISSYSY